jgi:hypothetical protein
MRQTLFVLFLILSTITVSKGQSLTDSPDTLFTIEVHAEGGPMLSIFRNRSLPENASPSTLGYNGILRVMWHPDHLLAVGALWGHQLLVAERFVIADNISANEVSASLSASPIMLDVSMQGNRLEVGAAIGGYIITSRIDDGGFSKASRFELGTIAHVSYRFSLGGNLFIGPEILISYMSYRGVLSLAPQIDLRYDLFRY